MTQITAVPPRRNFALWALVLLGAGLLSIMPLALLESPFAPAGPGAALSFDRTRVAYFAFDTGADTLWLADPQQPSNRSSVLTIEHAPEYGVIPSLAPDRRRLAYNVLPPETRAPAPDSPAQLWVVSLTGTPPMMLAQDTDLLVPAAWSPDGASVVFRRSDATSGQLVSVPSAGGSESILVESPDGLFPVGFINDGERLLYISLSEQGSDLRSVGASGGDDGLIGRLSEGLTRDWTLSPDGRHLAYLDLTFTATEAASRAYVFDILTGSRLEAGAAESDAFSPAWDAAGRLIVGQLRRDGRPAPATVVKPGEDGEGMLTAPDAGFDVPLAADAAGVAVTSFDGNSLMNPGRASLVVVDPAGVRREIATGEVTFLGWITP